MKGFLKFILNVAIYFAIVAGLMFGLPYLLTNWLGTEFPMAAITSGSMWPALKTGDLVLIQAVAKEDLKVGDIIVFKNADNSAFTIHRIASMGETTLTTKGDANFDSDKPIPYENVIGRQLVLYGRNVRIPLLGRVTMFAQNIKSNAGN